MKKFKTIRNRSKHKLFLSITSQQTSNRQLVSWLYSRVTLRQRMDLQALKVSLFPQFQSKNFSLDFVLVLFLLFLPYFEPVVSHVNIGTSLTSQTAFFGGVLHDFGEEFGGKGLGLTYTDGAGRRPDGGEVYEQSSSSL